MTEKEISEKIFLEFIRMDNYKKVSIQDLARKICDSSSYKELKENKLLLSKVYKEFTSLIKNSSLKVEDTRYSGPLKHPFHLEYYKIGDFNGIDSISTYIKKSKDYIKITLEGDSIGYSLYKSTNIGNSPYFKASISLKYLDSNKYIEYLKELDKVSSLIGPKTLSKRTLDRSSLEIKYKNSRILVFKERDENLINEIINIFKKYLSKDDLRRIPEI